VSDPEAFIAANLPVEPVPGVPGIRLHRAGPTSGLGRLAEADPGSPYWARPWGGGLALVRYLLDHPEAVAGRRVLDLGTGSGLVAIAAARAGALNVTAADISPHAIAAARLNAALNEVEVTAVLGDLTAGPAADADIVLVGDLFYDPELAVRVAGFLGRCRAAGVEVLIGDPWRAHLPRPRLRLLAEYEVADFGDRVGAASPAGVFALEA
jgi:predicted nicotinamide N-methyase